jgi:hypothetical protein
LRAALLAFLPLQALVSIRRVSELSSGAASLLTVLHALFAIDRTPCPVDSIRVATDRTPCPILFIRFAMDRTRSPIDSIRFAMDRTWHPIQVTSWGCRAPSRSWTGALQAWERGRSLGWRVSASFRGDS